MTCYLEGVGSQKSGWGTLPATLNTHQPSIEVSLQEISGVTIKGNGGGGGEV